MKLEAGKTYLTRSGRRVAVRASGGSLWTGMPSGMGGMGMLSMIWRDDGKCVDCGFDDENQSFDLVSLADAGDAHEEATFAPLQLPVVDVMPRANPDAGINGTTEPDVEKLMLLPADPAVRKGMPICTGVLDYFPLALAEVARVSKIGNDQHNPGQPLHWDRTKSLDHADCIPRHLIDRGSRDSDGMRHSAKLAWRALALLQTELESEQKAAK